MSANTKAIEFHEYANMFPFMSSDEFESLVENIKGNGLLEPIWLYQSKILDGRNRYKACIEAGVTPQFQEYKGNNPLHFSIGVNLERRHLDVGQRCALGKKLGEVIAKQKLEKQKADGAKGGRGNKKNLGADLRQGFTEAKREPKTSDEIAKTINVSSRTYENFSSAIKKAPELEEAIINKRISVDAAAKVAKLEPEKREKVLEKIEQGEKASDVLKKAQGEAAREEKVSKINEISKGNKPLDEGVGKFPIIYIDPPWRYDHSKSSSRAIENQYPTMSLDEIKSLDVNSVSLNDCVMLMWTTSPKLKDSFEVLLTLLQPYAPKN